MMRVRVTVSGWSGGPGLQTFYFTDASETNTEAGHCVTRVQAAIDSLKELIPPTVTYQVQSNVDVMNPVNGDITASLIGTTQPAIVGTAAGGLHLPPSVALVIRLHTDTFLAGRRLQGRAFISPLSTNNSTAVGIPAAAVHTIVNNFGNILNDTGSTSPLPVIWRRERLAVPTAVPPVTHRDGTTGRMTTSSLKPTFGVLRSRRQ